MKEGRLDQLRRPLSYKGTRKESLNRIGLLKERKNLTVTFLGEQTDQVVKAEISKTKNQQVMFMQPFQMTY